MPGEFQPDWFQAFSKPMYSGVGELVFIDGIMNSEVYKGILDINLQTFAKKLLK